MSDFQDNKPFVDPLLKKGNNNLGANLIKLLDAAVQETNARWCKAAGYPKGVKEGSAYCTNPKCIIASVRRKALEVGVKEGMNNIGIDGDPLETVEEVVDWVMKEKGWTYGRSEDR